MRHELLSGHTHTVHRGMIAFPNSGSQTYELRCGISMQVLNPTINPVTRRLTRRYFPATHSALVHRIEQDSAGKYWWETDEYRLPAKHAAFLLSGGVYRFPL